MNLMKNYLLLMLIIAAITFFIRSIPFLLFQNGDMPRSFAYMGKVLPFAMIGLLLIYALKDIDFSANGRGIPELIASGVVVLLHRLKRNPLLSIGGGTLIYMLLVQFVFV